MIKIQINHRYSGAVIFEHEVEGNTIKKTMEIAVKSGADLARANLVGADLVGADLDGANLAGATLVGTYLDGADLARANLVGANLAGANLARAYLVGAYLDGANLVGAYLDGANLAGATLEDGLKIIGENPIIQIGPIGSRRSYLVAYGTEAGIRLRTGCFFGEIDRFFELVKQNHGNNKDAKEYLAAVSFIKSHFDIWSEK